MRRNSLLLVVTLVLFIFASCSKKEKKESILPIEPKMEVTQADTTQVMSMVKHYLDLLQNNQVEDALGMLRYLDGDTIKRLPANLMAQQVYIHKKVRGVRYEIKKLVFNTEKDSELQYKLVLFDKTDKDDSRPNEIHFILKPVRRDGVWYLTFADTPSDTNGTHGTLIEN